MVQIYSALDICERFRSTANGGDGQTLSREEQRCLCREGNAEGPDSQRTRVAEDRRGRGVAKKPSAVAGTARSGRFEGRSGSERGTERGSSAKTVAPQAAVGYPIRARTAKKEILVQC